MNQSSWGGPVNGSMATVKPSRARQRDQLAPVLDEAIGHTGIGPNGTRWIGALNSRRAQERFSAMMAGEYWSAPP